MIRSLHAALAALLILAPYSPGQTKGSSDDIMVDIGDSDGSRSWVSQSSVGNLPAGRDLSGNPFASPMEFQVRISCPTTAGDSASPAGCSRAVSACTSGSAITGIGLLHEIYSRPVGTGDWRYLGSTCFADQVPGATPTITLPMIINAFHLTPWAKATLVTQPEGNTTLVGLPTYTRIVWSAAGYQPGEVDTHRLLGHTLSIRPRVDHHTYHFGDGSRFGPTRSDGGPYPTGDITHTYTAPGTYATRVDTTFTGDFRIDVGPWTPIPDTVTITGPTTTVTVKTAKPVLVR